MTRETVEGSFMFVGEGRPLWRRMVRRVVNGVFPERQIHLRTNGRIAYFRFSQWGQMAVAAFVAGATAWAAYASLSYVRHNDVVVAKDHQIANARYAYRSLLSEVATYQKKFSSITGELEDNHNLMLGLVEKNAALQRSLSTVEEELRVTQQDRERVAGARETLKGRLSQLEGDMHALSSKNFSLKGSLDSIAMDLKRALHERDQAHDEGKRLRQTIAALEQRLTDLQESQKTAVSRLTERAIAHIESVERVVALTGLELAKLLEADDGPKGQGGPFIPAKPDGLPGDKLKAGLNQLDNRIGQLEALQNVMQKLPLSAPLNSYRITSKFGKRRDPFNKKWAAHYGVDLGASIRAPVYATSPGVVTKAGWKGRYGRYIEIDHGAGLKTRYGHLHRVLVKRGQKVTFRQKIGLLGNSGRSTGPHIHYEVVFKGKPLNPMNFIKAGRYVFQR